MWMLSASMNGFALRCSGALDSCRDSFLIPQAFWLKCGISAKYRLGGVGCLGSNSASTPSLWWYFRNVILRASVCLTCTTGLITVPSLETYRVLWGLMRGYISKAFGKVWHIVRANMLLVIVAIDAQCPRRLLTDFKALRMGLWEGTLLTFKASKTPKLQIFWGKLATFKKWA